jgi:hypothetical protein
MEVIGHQHIGVQPNGKTSLRILEKVSELAKVISVLENGLFLIASTDHMVNGSGEMDAWFPTHEPPPYLTQSQKANNQSLTP